MCGLKESAEIESVQREPTVPAFIAFAHLVNANECLPQVTIHHAPCVAFSELLQRLGSFLFCITDSVEV